MKQSELLKFREELSKKDQTKPYVVLDLMYTIEEGQEVFNGTYDECEKFISEQGSFCSSMYDIIPNNKK